MFILCGLKITKAMRRQDFLSKVREESDKHYRESNYRVFRRTLA
jgi:hypothetical protein